MATPKGNKNVTTSKKGTKYTRDLLLSMPDIVMPPAAAQFLASKLWNDPNYNLQDMPLAVRNQLLNSVKRDAEEMGYKPGSHGTGYEDYGTDQATRDQMSDNIQNLEGSTLETVTGLLTPEGNAAMWAGRVAYDIDEDGTVTIYDRYDFSETPDKNSAWGKLRNLVGGGAKGTELEADSGKAGIVWQGTLDELKSVDKTWWAKNVPTITYGEMSNATEKIGVQIDKKAKQLFKDGKTYGNKAFATAKEYAENLKQGIQHETKKQLLELPKVSNALDKIGEGANKLSSKVKQGINQGVQNISQGISQGVDKVQDILPQAGTEKLSEMVEEQISEFQLQPQQFPVGTVPQDNIEYANGTGYFGQYASGEKEVGKGMDFAGNIVSGAWQAMLGNVLQQAATNKGVDSLPSYDPFGFIGTEGEVPMTGSGGFAMGTVPKYRMGTNLYSQGTLPKGVQIPPNAAQHKEGGVPGYSEDLGEFEVQGGEAVIKKPGDKGKTDTVILTDHLNWKGKPFPEIGMLAQKAVDKSAKRKESGFGTKLTEASLNKNTQNLDIITRGLEIEQAKFQKTLEPFIRASQNSQGIQGGTMGANIGLTPDLSIGGSVNYDKNSGMGARAGIRKTFATGTPLSSVFNSDKYGTPTDYDGGQYDFPLEVFYNWLRQNHPTTNVGKTGIDPNDPNKDRGPLTAKAYKAHGAEFTDFFNTAMASGQAEIDAGDPDPQIEEDAYIQSLGPVAPVVPVAGAKSALVDPFEEVTAMNAAHLKSSEMDLRDDNTVGGAGKSSLVEMPDTLKPLGRGENTGLAALVGGSLGSFATTLAENMATVKPVNPYAGYGGEALKAQQGMMQYLNQINAQGKMDIERRENTTNRNTQGARSMNVDRANKIAAQLTGNIANDKLREQDLKSKMTLQGEYVNLLERSMGKRMEGAKLMRDETAQDTAQLYQNLGKDQAALFENIGKYGEVLTRNDETNAKLRAYIYANKYKIGMWKAKGGDWTMHALADLKAEEEAEEGK